MATPVATTASNIGPTVSQISGQMAATGEPSARGCFWVPTRPGKIQQWDGAGGQLSIGHHGTWGRRTPFTRLVLTGLGPTPGDLVPAFEEMLLTPAEG